MILKLLGFEADEVVRVAAAGQITEADFRNEDRNPLETIVGSSWSKSRILLDLSAVTFIGTNGVGWLLRSNARCHADGGAMALFGMSPTVDHMLHMLRLDLVLMLAANEPAARKAMGLN